MKREKVYRPELRESRRRLAGGPTRAELRELRRRLQLVRRGHDLLERKQDALMVEFFRNLEEYRRLEREAAAAGGAAGRAETLAAMASGELAAWSYALTRSGRAAVEPEASGFMGVRLPGLRPARPSGAQRPVPAEPPWNLEAARAAEEFLAKLAGLAGAEARLRALLDEIERTKRRVNALEMKVIPDLEDQAGQIAAALEELEREGLFRIKRIKSKVGRDAAGAAGAGGAGGG